jgi:hypothetical protein
MAKRERKELTMAKRERKELTMAKRETTFNQLNISGVNMTETMDNFFIKCLIN